MFEWISYNRVGCTAFAIIATMIGLIVFGVCWSSIPSDEELHTMHQAWTNAANTAITFDEWNVLYRRESLPGQAKHKNTFIYLPN